MELWGREMVWRGRVGMKGGVVGVAVGVAWPRSAVAASPGPSDARLLQTHHDAPAVAVCCAAAAAAAVVVRGLVVVVATPHHRPRELRVAVMRALLRHRVTMTMRWRHVAAACPVQSLQRRRPLLRRLTEPLRRQRPAHRILHPPVHELWG